MLRRFGRQLAVSACEGIRKITDFDAAVASFSTSTWAMDQGSTWVPSQSGWQYCARHLHDRERHPRRSHVCASIRMPRRSNQAALTKPFSANSLIGPLTQASTS